MEESSFLGVRACFEVGYGCDFILCDTCLFLLHYDACMYVDVALLITLIVNEYEQMTRCLESLLDCMIIENILVIAIVIVACGMDRVLRFLLNNLDLLPRSGINMGSIAMFWHKHWIGYHVPIC
uniref:Uncharacterized protein n=1 Tax=Solanum tuberosum TaxID=4113 RepID=M1D8A7_SOLTU